MKWLGIVIIVSCTAGEVNSQPISADSLQILKDKLVITQPDTTRVSLLWLIGSKYQLSQPEIARRYFQEGLLLARRLNFPKGEADCLRCNGIALKQQGQYPEALDNFIRALKISEDIKDPFAICATLMHIGNFYVDQGDFAKGRTYYNRARRHVVQTHNNFQLANILMNQGISYQEQNNLDSALVFYNQAHEIMITSKNTFFLGHLYTKIGEAQAMSGNSTGAMDYFRKSIPFAIANQAPAHACDTYLGIANLFQNTGPLDSCAFYAKKALAFGQEINYLKGILASSKLLSEVYESTDKLTAYKYFKIAMTAKDSLFNAEKIKQIQNLGFVEQQRLQAIDDAKLDYHNKMRLYILLSLSGVFLVLAIVLFRNNRNKQIANRLLNEQKEEIQRTLNDLKTTQAQLIQSEKMASLGELTAGIAHEIQNPLNFVNNFSEVNKELIVEMKEQIEKGNLGEVISLAKDLEENQDKINHHGKRADAIVKGMLQHSRHASGVKEPTNINALVEEYSRLAYHGLRAKDKSFDANMNTNFDESIISANIIPQDIGRVILNIVNNAFYAVMEKKMKNGNALTAEHEGYEPLISLSTKQVENKILISVKDNGKGIPQTVLAKIFQPFFTTKPTGQGTGLGLSLSYDIIKAHGGELNVKSIENEGAEFTIVIPQKMV